MDGDIRSSSSELSDAFGEEQPLTNGGTPKKSAATTTNNNIHNNNHSRSSSSNSLKGSASPKVANGQKSD